MTAEQRDKSIRTGYLQIGNWGKLTHFSAVVFLCFFSSLLPIVNLWAYLHGNDVVFINGEIWVVVIPIILAFLVYRLQKYRLKFKVITTTLVWPQVLTIVESVAKEQKWTDKRTENKTITASTDPSIWSGSWGEQITVIYDNGHVFINSICDLKKGTSLVSWGRNADNMEAVMKGIKKGELGG
jgi:hypothetical protein